MKNSYNSIAKPTNQTKNLTLKWEEELNRPFFPPKRQTIGQQVHEKLFNITNRSQLPIEDTHSEVLTLINGIILKLLTNTFEK